MHVAGFCRCAGPRGAGDRSPTARRRAGPRPTTAGAVADRPDPDLWHCRPPAAPSGRRLRLAEPQAQEAETLSGAGRSRSRRSAPAIRRRVAVERAGCGCRSRRRRSPTSTPIPPAMAGTVPGQPPRKRLKLDDDPFGAVGDYAGSFLIKSAVELTGGYDTNPAPHRRPQGLGVLRGRAGIDGGLRLGAPRAGRRSARLLHRLRQHASRRRPTARSRRRRSISTGRISPAMSTAGSTSRRDTRLLGQVRLRLSHRQSRQPEHPGRARADIRLSPPSAAPSASTRTSTGCRSPPAPPSTAPSISIRELTDGTSTTNDDRNFNQYGGIGARQLRSDARRQAVRRGRGRQPRARRSGSTATAIARDSNGGYVKGGTSFEFSRLLTGEIAVGYAARDYADPRLNRCRAC